MTDNYKYFAFISFQNKDAKYAVAIQRQIENYRLPTALLRENNNLPKRVSPCYCYLNDMHHTEEMMQELRKRMQQSHYLIVLCSPNAVKSPYINAGIDYFVSLGRRDKIIPIIIDGTPYCNDENECFPDALKRHFPKHTDPLQDHSILGINFNEQGVASHKKQHKRAILMTVARMLELDFDWLAIREQQRQRQKSILWTSLIILILLLLIGVGLVTKVRTIEVNLTEQTTHNHNLPSIDNAILTIRLSNEKKSDTISSPDSTFIFHNIPPSQIGKPANITFRSNYYLPIDTQMILSRQICLPILRDSNYFGTIDIGVLGSLPKFPIIIYIENKEVEIKDNQRIQCQIPLSDQRTKYHIYSIPTYIDDTIYMPCGPSNAIEIPSKKLRL